MLFHKTCVAHNILVRDVLLKARPIEKECLVSSYRFLLSLYGCFDCGCRLMSGAIAVD
jgi:hypothetical protein